MEREIFEKIQAGETLDAREALMLEQALESGESVQVASWVEALEDAEPSLAWRSSLNEKLKACAPKPAKKRWSWAKPGIAVAGLAACTCLAMLFWSQHTPTPQLSAEHPIQENSTSGNLGDKVIGAYLSDEVELSGGVHTPRMVSDSGYDWSSL